MSSQKPLAVVGNVNVDLIMGPVAPWPDPGTEVIVEHDELRIGGSAANSALAWRAMNANFQLAANTGADLYGSWMREGLMPHAAGWPVAPVNSTISVGITHPDGERSFFTNRGHLETLSWPQVRDMLDWPGLAGGWLLLCGAFLTECLAADYDELFAQARRYDIRVALDTGWPPAGWNDDNMTRARHWAAQSDCLLANELEATELTGRACCDQALGALLKLVRPGGMAVVKCGPDGARAMQQAGKALHVAAPRVAVVDTIGAGDIFNAGFLFALASGKTVETALAMGTQSASRAISSSPRTYDFG
ncbi:carbohydrate kinase family protein [Actibacterium sp. MT2.3-13A]|uniref:carbohydrate kinase family protein n=1 Tax=Actibacterium sp. MT2.3-13A TaxID=2828332 RepID=UPI001BA956AC|nr:carbohydrate kinase family protein [Actibacterium sp. MT2.3-13A]